jgi:1-acyl-sn-glycerol-3-phosphate acyltransferase
MKHYLYTTLRFLFFLLIVRVVVLILLGLQIRRGQQLPKTGPAIIVANHNSHFDTIILISLFPLKLLPKIHPVAAADYFLKNKFLGWFSREIIGIIPLTRGSAKKDYNPLEPCYQALADNQILILFPEGTRGEPEKLSAFKKGIAFISQRYPNIPITPVYLHGVGKVLPKGEFIPIPFFCDVFVGENLVWPGDKKLFMEQLEKRFQSLTEEGHFAPWE